MTLPADGGGLAVIKKVLEVHGRMDIILTLAYEQLPLDRGEPHLPDEWEPGNPQYKLWLRASGNEFTTHASPIWENGNVLRAYFLDPDKWKGLYNLFELTDQEFNDFMTDSFDPNNRRFRYSMSAPGKYSFVMGMLIGSNGPDRDRDIDISKFSLERQDFGLGADLVDRIYDPTNGIVSNGDILVSGGGGPCKELRGSIYPWKSCRDD